MIPSSADVTELLVAWSDGDKSAEKELFSLVYRELRRLAHRYMLRENPGNTLQTTALVNEAYVRLIDRKRQLAKSSSFLWLFSSSHAAYPGGSCPLEELPEAWRRGAKDRLG
jgi:DNA-directed RNA polymerase specialized sigma24 family protein